MNATARVHCRACWRDGGAAGNITGFTVMEPTLGVKLLGMLNFAPAMWSG
jgi:hypothetical protein